MILILTYISILSSLQDGGNQQISTVIASNSSEQMYFIYSTFLNKVNDVSLSVDRPESVDCHSAVRRGIDRYSSGLEYLWSGCSPLRIDALTSDIGLK